MDHYQQLAKDALSGFLKNQDEIFEYPQYLPKELKQKKAGVFVSLHNKDELRGCIGTLEPTQANIALEIVANAISAAFHDPRFNPITEKELPALDFTIDIIGKLEAVNSITELNPKIYGIYIEKNKNKAVLLPALAGIDSIDQQIAVVLKKAGISTGIYGCKIFRFKTERHW